MQWWGDPGPGTLLYVWPGEHRDAVRFSLRCSPRQISSSCSPTTMLWLHAALAHVCDDACKARFSMPAECITLSRYVLSARQLGHTCKHQYRP